jgi:hypothetical protein
MLNKLKVGGGVGGLFYFYLYPFGDLTQRSFHENFHMFINKGQSFLRGFLTTNELRIIKI